MTPQAVKFFVAGQPVPKPRMTRRDKWMKRPIVERYVEYKTRIIQAWARAGGLRFSRAALSCQFYVRGHQEMDLDNLVKAVCDSLQPWAIRKDTIDHIPSFRAAAFRVPDIECAGTSIELLEAPNQI